MKKTFISLLLVLSCGISTYAYAMQPEDMQTFESKNEFEVYEELQSYSIDELIDIGYTEDEAVNIKDTSFEELILERADLPAEQLENMGYSTKDIEVLKAYDGEEVAADSEVVTRASAVLTGTITKVSSSGSNYNRMIQVKYTWSWDKTPLFNAKDQVGMLCLAGDVDGTMKATAAANYVIKVDYKNLETGKVSTKNQSVEKVYAQQTGGVLVKSEFNMRIGQFTDNESWAKSGLIEVGVMADGRYEMNLVDVKATYGHATMTVDLSLGISDSGAGISVTPKAGTDEFSSTKRIKF